MSRVSYQGFCWCLGTTSFRTKNFNKTIETQLMLLDDFWDLRDNKGQSWGCNSQLQSRYYDYMKECQFVEGSAPNKPKDAREKTSGLVALGLLDANRKLTESGRALLHCARENDFDSDNFFQIPKDSEIYLRQLLKMSVQVNNDCVRPFYVLLYTLSKVGYLSLDEFTYLLPLCTTSSNTNEIIDGIVKIRKGQLEVDDVILQRLMEMDNYQNALLLLHRERVTESLICEVGMNRKSRSYDRAYFPLYVALFRFFFKLRAGDPEKILSATKKIKIGRLWRAYLFDSTSDKAIIKNPRGLLKPTLFDKVSNEAEFKTVFFKVMHLLKAKATLSDYLDLNRRYMRTSDIVLFEDERVSLDIVPRHYFDPIAEQLFKKAFSKSDVLPLNCTLPVIDPCLTLDEDMVLAGVIDELGIPAHSISEAKEALDKVRYIRLEHLIDEKFSDSQIIALLDAFVHRDDDLIQKMVTDNADIPTIFEYVLGILWYKISERRGKILSFMKLSLDANLLPKTHASGGTADIVYKYDATVAYPAHDLLIEATLAEPANQRKMEMEPVSRHLGRHLLETNNLNSYCLFATTVLDPNIVADFRSRKNIPWYDVNDDTRFITGMKIIPLQTSDLKQIVNRRKTYKELYHLFSTAFKSTLLPRDWYNKMHDCLCQEFQSGTDSVIWRD